MQNRENYWDKVSNNRKNWEIKNKKQFSWKNRQRN